MIEWKPNVRVRPRNLGCFTPEIQVLLQVALTERPPTIGEVVVMTSANDGEHMDGSKHYEDRAVDIRVRSSDPTARGNVIGQDLEKIVESAHAWVGRIKLGLAKRGARSKDYDLVVEKRSTQWGPAVHLHAEFDPKETI